MTIPNIILDKEDDELLLAKALDAARAKGIIATHEGSPVKVLLEGLTFLLAEYRWFLNLLPQALALEVFKSTGLARSNGARATGNMTILLDRILSTDFTLPQGFSIGEYVTTQSLVIPSGTQSGTVPIEALEIGEIHNASPFQKYYSNIITFVETAYNEEPITGGRDTQDIENYISDIQQVLRTKETLLSANDYEEYLADKGIIAYCFGQVNELNQPSNDNSGNVHIYVTDDNHQDIPNLTKVATDLQSKSFVGSSIFVSNVERQFSNLEVVAEVNAVSEDLLTQLLININDSVRPSKIRPGTGFSIQELGYVVRNTPGVLRVNSVTLGGLSIDSTVDNFYTLPILDAVVISLVDTNRNTASRTVGSVGGRDNMDGYDG